MPELTITPPNTPPFALPAPLVRRFAALLAPMPTEPASALAESRRRALTVARGSKENFSVLSALVPVRARPHFAALYAYCRVADDLGDDRDEGAPNDTARALALLAAWRSAFRASVGLSADSRPDAAGAAVAPLGASLFPALAETMRERQLDSAPFEHLLDAFEQDQRVTRYATWDQLLDYCTRSANPVGRLVLGVLLDRPPAPEMLAASDELCTALQLINFWQDVRRDLVERDRIYLPSEEFALTEAELRRGIAEPENSLLRVAYIRALRPLVERTRELFERSSALMSMLPPHARPVVGLFHAGGVATLEEVERAGCTTLWRRPSVPTVQRLFLVARAFVASRLVR
ncbi:MAG: squalene/phytoene synthase family protein [Planctomycetota bacterium]|nr:squalene/phytoene synthase family protein [Planctomycetota bacterium]